MSYGAGSGIRTHVPVTANNFQDCPVMTTSVSQRMTTLVSDFSYLRSIPREIRSCIEHQGTSEPIPLNYSSFQTGGIHATTWVLLFIKAKQ